MDQSDIEEIAGNAASDMDPSVLAGIIIGVISAVMLFSVFQTLLKIFLLNPLAVGCDKFFQQREWRRRIITFKMVI